MFVVSPIVIVPESGCIRPKMQLNSVLLPHPLGPTIPSLSKRLTLYDKLENSILLFTVLDMFSNIIVFLLNLVLLDDISILEDESVIILLISLEFFQAKPRWKNLSVLHSRPWSISTYRW